MFWLYSHTVPDVFDDPALLSQLTSFAEQQAYKTDPSGLQGEEPGEAPDQAKSLLLLQVLASADFFTTNASLMSSPPRVLVDIGKWTCLPTTVCQS